MAVVMGGATALPAQDSAHVSAALTPEGGHITVEARTAVKTLPSIYAGRVDEVVRVAPTEVTGEAQITFRVIQGKPEIFTVGVSGDGEISEVTGPGVRDWSVRQNPGSPGGKRVLEIRSDTATTRDEWNVRVRFRKSDLKFPLDFSPLTFWSADAVSFEWHGRVEPNAFVDLEVTRATHVAPVEVANNDARALEFIGRDEVALRVHAVRRGAAGIDVELGRIQLKGRVDEAAHSLAFTLQTQARVESRGARVHLLSGDVGLTGRSAGDGWHVEVNDDDTNYDVVFERKGIVNIETEFIAPIREDGDWRRVKLSVAAANIAAVSIVGFYPGIVFDREATVVLDPTAGAWVGYLPANGAATLAWKRTQEKQATSLLFTSNEQSEVRIGAGLARQTTQLALRVMQGQLDVIRLRLDGPGEIVGVHGTNVVNWSVTNGENVRELEVRLSRPIEKDGNLTIESQAVLAEFPVNTEVLRISPEEALRHSGFVRIANSGAVRLDVLESDGMLQLAPSQFPGAAAEPGARQVFVYRFPTASRRFRIAANQILPEVGVSELVTYTLGETERTIAAEIELDVREAPLREWSVVVPSDYSVVGVQGADVADYVAELATGSAGRTVKVFFRQPVDGRHLLQLRLEKNQTAATGEWRLPQLQFPAAKSVRGHVGVISTPGYRLIPATIDHLTEVPLAYFPRQISGLKQAYRVRDAEWSAALHIEAMGQSVHADVFHLYALKDTGVSASILINYFVVGAPTNEWRVEVPADAGNIDVIGQGVRREWRREGNTVVVALHQPILGAATLLITFERPMSAHGGVLQPGEVKPMGVSAERGYLQVVSPVQVKTTIDKVEGNLLKLEPLELPSELRLLTTAPAVAAYQYTARPFTLDIGVAQYPSGEVVDQVVDFAKFTSRVARDGQVVTDGRLFVKTRGRKLLRLQLPKEMALWETRVDGELVTARADGAWTLIPLTARLNPNEPVQVTLRLGQTAVGAGRNLVLTAPKMAMPLVIGEWTLRAERDHLLVPRGGTAELTEPNLTETGFEWIVWHEPVMIGLVLGVAALSALVMRLKFSGAPLAALVGGVFVVLLTLSLMGEAVSERRANELEVSYAATVVPSDGAMTVQLSNLPEWQAMLSPWGLGVMLAGVGCWALARRRNLERVPRGRAMLAIAGTLAIVAGSLAQRGGAALFFAECGMAAIVWLIAPGLRVAWQYGISWWRARRGTPPSATAATVSALVLAIVGWGTCAVPKAQAEAAPEVFTSAETPLEIAQRWEIREGRLFGDVDISVRGVPGDSFLLLKAPAVLTEFVGEGLRVTKLEREGTIGYYVTPERAGVLKGKAKFELPLPEKRTEIPVLTGKAAVQRVTITLDQPGWEFSSPMAVEVKPGTGNLTAKSSATLTLGATGAAVVHLAPVRRNLEQETPQYAADVATLILPAPGAVTASARVTIKPIQGRVTALDIVVPKGFAVADMTQGPVGTWRFDPEKGTLHLALEPAQSEPFSVQLELQLPLRPLPSDVVVKPIHVEGAIGQVGIFGLAFGADAQPEQVRPTELSQVSTDDFDASLLPRGRDGHVAATLQSAYRYSQSGATLALRVAPVLPEVRVAARQLLSLGDDRLVIAADLTTTITRVGLFQLSFVVPSGMEVEGVSGATLSHWTDAEEDGRRIVTLHLKGRTIGEQTFAVSLAGPAPAMATPWTIPEVRLREATRQTGEVQVVPERGLRLRTVDRRNVTELDPRSLGQSRPGTLAFRVLEDNWTLTLGIEPLEPWVTVQALQDVTAREGQTLTRLAFVTRVENAAVKHLTLRLPGLTSDQAKTVRAVGPAVSDIVAIPGDAERWDVRFQRGVLGESPVQIEYQGTPGTGGEGQMIATPTFEGARQVTQFVAVRGGGRLDVEARDVPRGWQRVDWSSVPTNLQDRSDRSVPALTFRVAEPEKPLTIVASRHAVADALKLRVAGGELLTLISADGQALTAVELRIDVAEKSTLRLRLPTAARLFHATINGESVAVVRDGDAYLVHVSSISAVDRSARLRVVYGTGETPGHSIVLQGPRLNVPLENVTWRVVLPPGYDLARYRGGLQREGEVAGAWFGVNEYEAMVVSRRDAEAKLATQYLQTANTLLQHGEQQQAGEVLSRAAKANSLDAASNEDVRVQLRALRTEQAVVGLNTRRQRLYLDNSAEGQRNEQLEHAVNLNPLMRGKLDFDPQQVDQLLAGNSVEENAALRGIAGRIVDQQLAAEPAPRAIDVSLPERGRVVTFGRSLQVNGDAPLELALTLKRTTSTGYGFGAAVLLGIAAIVGLVSMKQRIPA